MVYISDPGVVSSRPVSSHDFRPDKIIGQPPLQMLIGVGRQLVVGDEQPAAVVRGFDRPGHPAGPLAGDVVVPDGVLPLHESARRVHLQVVALDESVLGVHDTVGGFHRPIGKHV